MKVKELLVNTLNSFGYPVYLQGTLPQDEPYDETFITYVTDDVPSGEHFDNEAKSYYWDFLVYFYTSNIDLIDSKVEEIREKLEEAGFISQGKGQGDIPSDEPTHKGWVTEYYYREE